MSVRVWLLSRERIRSMEGSGRAFCHLALVGRRGRLIVCI